MYVVCTISIYLWCVSRSTFHTNCSVTAAEFQTSLDSAGSLLTTSQTYNDLSWIKELFGGLVPPLPINAIPDDECRLYLTDGDLITTVLRR